jgi:23S rRNA (cytidine1920-2'-O)/16S rRNA (cytidine1409-2'-O)-methyltransferase
MSRQRLDKEMMRRGLAATRSQAEDMIKRGFVMADGEIITKPGLIIDEQTRLSLIPKTNFVSRAGEKLFSVKDELGLHFKNRVVLDVGSSTGGFTDLALREGAQKVIAVDVGSNQLHPELRNNPSIELHEKTDIRKFQTNEKIDLVLIDVSFISLRDVLPYIAKLTHYRADIVAMVKPQFEAVNDNLKHKGVIKNDRMRRDILKSFENWAQAYFIIEIKADSKVAGAKGNVERFYKLRTANSKATS